MLAAWFLLVTVVTPGMLAADPVMAAVPAGCSQNVHPGDAFTTTPWPQKQLNFQAAWSASEGEYVSSGQYEGTAFHTGEPVPIAVIDSGYDDRNPALAGARVRLDQSILPAGTTDCVGHGTEVTSIISAPQTAVSRFVGVAPQASVLAIKYTNQATGGSAHLLAEALKYAISQHVRVINLSSQLPRPVAEVKAQVAAAQRAGIVLVTVGGNDSSQTGDGPYWPAMWSTKFSNVITVSAVAQDGGQGDGFSVPGKDVDVAAPGVNVPVAVRIHGFDIASGTSFAAPFVTGTVALILATHPDMRPVEVRNRLEATADPPPGTQPNAHYGWGTINPLLAVTSQRNDAVATPTNRPGRPLAAPLAARAPSRTLEHRAIAIAVVLLGLAVLTVTGAAILRGNRRAHARRT